ncbi:MAG: hypothetical protein RL757_1325 [Bacteroidota bacterium]|jgi:hypothetical protein
MNNFNILMLKKLFFRVLYSFIRFYTGGGHFSPQISQKKLKLLKFEKKFTKK